MQEPGHLLEKTSRKISGRGTGGTAGLGGLLGMSEGGKGGYALVNILGAGKS